MSEDALAPEVVCWSSPEKAALAQRVLEAMGPSIRILAFGGPTNREVDAAAKALGVPSYDDLRQTLIDSPPRYLLLAGCESVLDDVFAIAQEAGIRVLTLDPVAASLVRLATHSPSGHHANPEAAATLLPAFHLAPSLMQLGDVDEHLGARRLIKAVSIGPAEHQDLFTRLYDLWSSVLAFVDAPETVAASLSGVPTGEHGVPENPRRLDGHIAVHARGLAGTAVLLHAGISPQNPPLPPEEEADVNGKRRASDRPIYDERHLQVFGDRGRLTLTDHGFDLANEFDGFHDRSVLTETPPADFVQVCAARWQQLIERSDDPTGFDPATRVEREEQALACCLACQLSARTGQAESPFTVAQMGR